MNTTLAVLTLAAAPAQCPGGKCPLPKFFDPPAPAVVTTAPPATPVPVPPPAISVSVHPSAVWAAQAAPVPVVTPARDRPVLRRIIIGIGRGIWREYLPGIPVPFRAKVKCG